MIEILYFIMYVVITFIIGTMLFIWHQYRRPKAKGISRKDNDGWPYSGDNNIVIGYKDN